MDTGVEILLLIQISLNVSGKAVEDFPSTQVSEPHGKPRRSSRVWPGILVSLCRVNPQIEDSQFLCNFAFQINQIFFERMKIGWVTFKKTFSYLFESQGYIQGNKIFHLLGHYPNGWNLQGWSKLKPTVRNFFQVSQEGGRNLSTWTIFPLFSQNISREPGWKRNSRDIKQHLYGMPRSQMVALFNKGKMLDLE